MTACCHHWLVEPPNGTPTVQGECKHCGAVKAFEVAAYVPNWNSRGKARLAPRWPGDDPV